MLQKYSTDAHEGLECAKCKIMEHAAGITKSCIYKDNRIVFKLRENLYLIGKHASSHHRFNWRTIYQFKKFSVFSETHLNPTNLM